MHPMTISDSVSKILDSNLQFGRAFYATLFHRCPQVEVFFRGVNMERQAAVLTISLLVIENYGSAQHPAMAKYLRDLGEKHQEREISAEIYPSFRDALREALADFHGDDWHDQLALQWDIAIDQTIRAMLKGYEPAKAASR